MNRLSLVLNARFGVLCLASLLTACGGGKDSGGDELLNLSDIDSGDCTFLENMEKSELESKIRFADSSCIKGLVEKHKIDLNQPMVGVFGDKGPLPLESALGDSALFFSKKPIALGADPNKKTAQGKTLTELAIGLNDKFSDLSKYWLRNPQVDAEQVGSRGSPLEQSLNQKHEGFVEILVNRSVSVQKSSLRSSPLHLAIAQKLENSAKLLIDKGADINLDVHGDRPLQAAIRQGLEATASYLVAKNAQLDMRNSSGQTVLHQSL